MNIKYFIAKGLKKILNPPALNNCLIDSTARVCSRSELTSVKIQRYSYVGNQCFLVNVDIGSFCSIADRCCIGGANHPIDRVSTSPVFHDGKNIMGSNFALHPAVSTPKTIIENDVWIGMGCYIKAGVTIHNGSIVGMGSVVTHDVPAYEIWAGNPARKIRDRFDDNMKRELLDIKWWNWDEKMIRENAHLFNDPVKFADQIKENNNI